MYASRSISPASNAQPPQQTSKGLLGDMIGEVLKLYPFVGSKPKFQLLGFCKYLTDELKDKDHFEELLRCILCQWDSNDTLGLNISKITSEFLMGDENNGNDGNDRRDLMLEVLRALRSIVDMPDNANAANTAIQESDRSIFKVA